MMVSLVTLAVPLAKQLDFISPFHMNARTPQPHWMEAINMLGARNVTLVHIDAHRYR
jgi:hypothetical protein